MTFNVLTIFPGMFSGFLGETMMKRGIESNTVKVNLVDIREHATDKHKTTDDTPYGGGAGMVMKIEPIYRALEVLGQIRNSKSEIRNTRVALLSPRGKQFDQRKAEEYAKLDSLTLICGRYEGVDHRVAEHLADEELSIGPYVLSGGEVASMVAMEAVARLIPGFLGNPDSLKEETFSLATHDSQLITPVEYPQYTKPDDFMGWKVPDVLLSGDHQKVAAWRNQHSRES